MLATDLDPAMSAAAPDNCTAAALDAVSLVAKKSRRHNDFEWLKIYSPDGRKGGVCDVIKLPVEIYLKAGIGTTTDTSECGHGLTARCADLFEWPRTIQALNTVPIHPQVGGQLTEIPFAEGLHVKKGDVLAKIDPRLFQAVCDQAVAKKAQDEANLISAEKDLTRAKTLVVRSLQTEQLTRSRPRWIN
jgi:hypothetical protein